MDHEYSVSQEDAIASQFYVAEVVQSHPSRGAEVGDRELILADSYLRTGYTKTSNTYGGNVPPKKLEVIGGPFECPPMPHVLALGMWLKEERPKEPWDLYSGDSDAC